MQAQGCQTGERHGSFHIHASPCRGIWAFHVVQQCTVCGCLAGVRVCVFSEFSFPAPGWLRLQWIIVLFVLNDLFFFFKIYIIFGLSKNIKTVSHFNLAISNNAIYLFCYPEGRKIFAEC
jgi:hypothetical protein